MHQPLNQAKIQSPVSATTERPNNYIPPQGYPGTHQLNPNYGQLYPVLNPDNQGYIPHNTNMNFGYVPGQHPMPIPINPEQKLKDLKTQIEKAYLRFAIGAAMMMFVYPLFAIALTIEDPQWYWHGQTSFFVMSFMGMFTSLLAIMAGKKHDEKYHFAAMANLKFLALSGIVAWIVMSATDSDPSYHQPLNFYFDIFGFVMWPIVLDRIGNRIFTLKAQVEKLTALNQPNSNQSNINQPSLNINQA